MINLFNRCLRASYKLTENGGNYSIEVEGDTIFILFEWSRGVVDWLSNFNFPKKPYKRMDVVWYAHRGFLKVWKGMRDKIECEVSNILHSSPDLKKIICVGYSHGGALAMLATEDMEYVFSHKIEVSGYGFGAPRVTWGTIPGSVKERLSNYYLIRNLGDIVTHLPPKIFGYRDAQKIIGIGEKWKYNPIEAHYSKSYKTEMEGKENG